MELQKIVIGDKVTDKIYVLKSIRNGSNGNYDVVLKDKTGELFCELARERLSVRLEEGSPVKVTFIVTNGVNTTPKGIIKQIELASKDEFTPSELYDGLSAEKIAEYVRMIRQGIQNIPDETVRNMTAWILNDETLTRLSNLPASLGRHGRYRGGALAATAVVTKMVMQAALMYCKGDNGLYEPSLDWSTLISASLLHAVGTLDYFTSEMPFAKTAIGIERGYASVLQHHIEAAVMQSGIEVPEMTLARIFNILGSSVPMKTEVKATRAEGSILRKCLELYEDLDMRDAAIAEHETEEGEEYFYAVRSRRYISLSERTSA